MKYHTKNEEETKNIGKKFATELKGGEILCLYGDLGAGKTTFVKGLAEGYGIKEHITSPTFTLMNIYKISTSVLNLPSVIKNLIHIDTYRLKNQDELIEIGAEDYIGKDDTISIIEWPEKIEELIKDKITIKININHLQKDEREIIVE